MTVYLAGPINKCSDHEAISWRDRAKKSLHAAGIETIDPMRRDYRGEEGDFVEAIVQGDLEDIRDSDTVLAHVWRPSCGTSMEAWEASEHLGKGVVLVADEDCSPWLKKCADVHFTQLQDALEYLK